MVAYLEGKVTVIQGLRENGCKKQHRSARTNIGCFLPGTVADIYLQQDITCSHYLRFVLGPIFSCLSCKYGILQL
jgi:hypothetical protein